MLQIITDSASDITLAQAAELNVRIVPLNIQFADGLCPQETDADFVTFYDRLQRAAELPTTSQPSPESYLALYETAQAAGDEVLVLTLSGGLSGTVNAARIAADLCGYDKIYILDTCQAIAAQRLMVQHAAALRDRGLNAAQVLAELETLRDRVTVSGVIDTLTYLRKGGRIPASLAMLGNTLRIKPVIVLEDGVIKTVGKVMGHAAGVKLLWQRFEQAPPDPAFPLWFVYTSDREKGRQFMEQTVEKYGLQDCRPRLVPIGGVIGTHLGTGGVGICYVKAANP